MNPGKHAANLRERNNQKIDKNVIEFNHLNKINNYFNFKGNSNVKRKQAIESL